MTFLLCLLSSALVLGFLMLPFFVGPGGKLFAHSALNSAPSLEHMKQGLLSNYIKGEDLFQQHKISKREWEQRQQFLTNRYLEASRRLDYIRFQKTL